jgi:hypothetical protein
LLIFPEFLVESYYSSAGRYELHVAFGRKQPLSRVTPNAISLPIHSPNDVVISIAGIGSPASVSRSVDFPEPEGPMIAMIDPGWA